MDLHPMFRDGITAKDAIFVEAWHG